MVGSKLRFSYYYLIFCIKFSIKLKTSLFLFNLFGEKFFAFIMAFSSLSISYTAIILFSFSKYLVIWSWWSSVCSLNFLYLGTAIIRLLSFKGTTIEPMPPWVITIFDSLHNFTDGIVIAASFLIDINLGLVAGITILVHELAHETGDFGILLHSGYSKKKAFTYNIISSSTTIPAAIISYFILGPIEFVVPYLLAISAASFIYIALSDLTPDLHQHTDFKYILRQLLVILAGILLMAFLLSIGGHEH